MKNDLLLKEFIAAYRIFDEMFAKVILQEDKFWSTELLEIRGRLESYLLSKKKEK